MNAELASLTILLLLPAWTGAQQALKCHDPLSEAQLTELVKGSVPPLPIQQNVASCGIDFDPTEEAISRLRSAGVPESVLDAVRVAAGPTARGARRTSILEVRQGQPGARRSMRRLPSPLSRWAVCRDGPAEVPGPNPTEGVSAGLGRDSQACRRRRCPKGLRHRSASLPAIG